MKQVLILYRFLPQYRVPFYEGLRAYLREVGVDLRLAHGDGDEVDRAKGDLVELDWAHRVANRIIQLPGARLYWQPALNLAKDADLVIVEQASRLLINYILLGQQAVGRRRVAFWGHGRNFQAGRQHGIAEWVKRRVSTLPTWWFAYNQRSADIVMGLGYPRERITIVQNAIDTTRLRMAVASVTDAEKLQFTTELGLNGQMLGVYMGGLYPEKRIALLIEAARLVKAQVPQFELIIAGDGPDRSIAEHAAASHEWVRYLGPVFGDAKARLLASSRVMLMPGLVGLAVLDAFAGGLPLATTDVPFHSPEIEYLQPGVMGLCTRHDPHTFANAVSDLLRDTETHSRMSQAALEASRHYTIENMVKNFGDGILNALDRR
jgi:L-malate glycosyltransferase